MIAPCDGLARIGACKAPSNCCSRKSCLATGSRRLLSRGSSPNRLCPKTRRTKLPRLDVKYGRARLEPSIHFPVTGVSAMCCRCSSTLHHTPGHSLAEVTCKFKRLIAVFDCYQLGRSLPI